MNLVYNKIKISFKNYLLITNSNLQITDIIMTLLASLLSTNIDN
jgi:hypothetical protein